MDNYAVFGLYQAPDETSASQTLAEVEAGLDRATCRMKLSGEIVDVAGPMKLPKSGHFFVATCPKPMLRSIESRAAFKSLLALDEVVIIEGEISGAFAARDYTPEGVFVFKVSEYKNDDPDKMQQDLDSLNAAAESRADHFETAGSVAVTDAIGIETPDEVVVITYSSGEAATSFRANNDDILEAIGRFNSEHIAGFAYVSVKQSK